MVLDATASAFPQLATLGNQSHSAVNQPILAAAKPSIAQSVPDTSNRPAKRRRTLQANVNHSPMTSSPGPSSASSTIDFDALDAARRRSSARVMSLWESLAARYARPLDEDDEIDILTGKIYKDRGVLRAASEKGWKIGSFGETIEVEPVVSASEAETETGTSECDDAEGEDTAGDTEDADEEEEDPFETWSYDWQYRQLPPPRPELSPQDAEDLKEFLAAEHAIQEENTRTSGNQPKLAEDEDEVVYLGDNLHDQDGALLGDDSDDEEFASFAVDDTTVRLTKHEEDEEDSIGPMSSILGALALGKTPQKRLSASTRTESPVDTKTAKLVDSSGQSTRVRAETHGTPSIGNARPNTSPSANARSGPKARIEDDIIDIDSDTDQEDDADMGSALDSSPSAKDRVSKLSAPGVRPALSVSDSSGIVRQGRTSFSAMVASLQASTIVDEPKLKTTAVSPCSTPPRSKSATKPTSKGMRSNTTTTTKNTKASSTPRTSASGSLPSPANTLKKRPGAATPTTPVRSAAPTPKLSSRPNAISPSRPVETSARPTSVTAHKASAKTPLKRTDKPERSFVATTEPRNEPTREMVGGGTDAVNSKPAKGNITIPVSEPPGSSTPAVGKASKPAQLASPPISSSSRSARPESPTK
ncbi:hypothetical protein FRC07_001635 [Ceratobasidium sp. 392]|nr:hypothetical protein FRC07_001635 [Ceratobasidium sp. 392]